MQGFIRPGLFGSNLAMEDLKNVYCDDEDWIRVAQER
jgi:hypothetical protein